MARWQRRADRTTGRNPARSERDDCATSFRAVSRLPRRTVSLRSQPVLAERPTSAARPGSPPAQLDSRGYAPNRRARHPPMRLGPCARLCVGRTDRGMGLGCSSAVQACRLVGLNQTDYSRATSVRVSAVSLRGSGSLSKVGSVIYSLTGSRRHSLEPEYEVLARGGGQLALLGAGSDVRSGRTAAGATLSSSSTGPKRTSRLGGGLRKKGAVSTSVLRPSAWRALYGDLVMLRCFERGYSGPGSSVPTRLQSEVGLKNSC